MELKDAYQNLRVSKEEKKSIERYLGFQHTSINILGSLEPYSYARLDKAGWSLPESAEDIKQYIQDFVNVYSAMYKESRGSKQNGHLIRGTSNKEVRSLHNETNHFLSSSTKEDIARTFCEYEDAALVRINVGEGVPYLNAEDYRNENSRDEAEIIIAPFCKVSIPEHQSSYRGYDYYKISVQKPALEEKSQEEIDGLLDKVVSGFTNNIKNLKEYNDLKDRREYLDLQYKRAIQRGDREDLNYISQDQKKVADQSFELYKSTEEFKKNLQDLLKGMCKQKELEIDKSYEVIQEEQKRIAEENKKRQEEEKERQKALEKEKARQGAISDIRFKKEATPVNTFRLESTIDDTYNRLIISEHSLKNTATRLGISLSRSIADSGISQNIEAIKENLRNVNVKVVNTEISKDISLEDVTEISRELTPLADGVAYSLEITKNFPDIIKMYNSQADTDLKRNLYLKVQGIIQNARIQKYEQEKQAISTRKVGFLGRITGADKLKEEQLRNINLKIRALQTEVPQEQAQYSVRDMLADIYACAISDFSGELTPEMKQMSDAIKANFTDRKNGAFTDQYINGLAMEKIEAKRNRELPVVQGKKPRFFQSTKSKIENIMLENQGLQNRIAQNQNTGNRWGVYQSQEGDALTIFENQLRGISSTTKEKQQEKADPDITAQLW